MAVCFERSSVLLGGLPVSDGSQHDGASHSLLELHQLIDTVDDNEMSHV